MRQGRMVTSRLVELMEQAAARSMRQRLSAGESSETVDSKLTHLAPATAGATVRTVATWLGCSGRLHRFIVHAFDETGLIASCEHTRAVVLPRLPAGRLLQINP
jgi:predicted thioesterase